jgi:hypothetical protein
MFISSAEKSIINARIEFLEARVRDLTDAVLKAQKLASKIEKANAKTPEEKTRKSYAWSSENKSAASERMKKYWANKKANTVAA